MADRPRQTVLVPVIFPEPNRLEDAYFEGLDGFHVILMGYWEIPGGANPETAREKHETEAEAILYEMAAKFSHAGAETDIQLHFGPAGSEREELQDKILAETDPDGVMMPGKLSMPNNILVPLRDDRNLVPILDFLSQFDRDEIFAIELYHVTPDESGVEAGEELLAEVEEMLLERGFSESDVQRTVEVAAGPGDAIASAADDHNVVILGETEELSDQERFFGPTFDRIAEQTSTPIVVIRQP